MAALLQVYAQQYSVSGIIKSKDKNTGLSYANVRVLGTMNGAASNNEGVYELKLTKDSYGIVASYIGYKSDTVYIDLKNNIKIDFILEPVSLELQEVTVNPGVNPAIEIIRKAVEARKQRNENLNDYQFTAYTKGLIRTTEDIKTGDNSVGVGIGTSDTAELKITGILENESRGFFKKPESYKEEIVARKQSANFPASINTLTGGRIIQDFYSDDIRFFDRDLLSPISEDAVDYYFFLLKDSLAYDNRKVYQIYFEPDDRSDPGFYGEIFITGDTYNLVKLDININSAANPGGVFSRVNVFQQFLPFGDNIYMPIDYRLFVEGNLLGLFKFGFSINSIMYDYRINSKIQDNFFDMSILTVLPDADIKDSVYWSSIQTIPETMAETDAYSRIDSLESIPVTFWDKFSFLSDRSEISDQFQITGPLGLYHFNRIEGNGLNFGFYFNNLINRRFDASLEFSNGFADNRIKWELDTEYLMGTYRTHSLTFNAYQRLDVLFNESDEYNTLLPTLTSLFGKYDFKDYYYTDGLDLEIKSEVLPVLEIGMGFTYQKNESAFTNSDFSFFNRGKEYDTNPLIFSANITALKPSFKIDFRKYIEDGYYRRRTSQGKSYVLFSGDAVLSRKGFLGINSGIDFNIYKFNVWSTINSFWSTDLDINIKTVWSNDALPYQFMYALPGNIETLGQDFTFRTLNFAEVYGDKVITAGLNYNFKDILFDKLNLPVIEDLQLLLGIHLNAAWSSISDNTIKLNYGLLPAHSVEYKKPLVELGFSIGQMLLPLRFEFTWRLSHFGNNNFMFGINSAAF